MTTIDPAELKFSPEGVPFSERYGDVYHSASGALEQARHVFLAGNELPARWQGRQGFTIIETGFGLGNNFLATWQAWREDPQACATLHFISVEKHPFSAADMASALQGSGAPEELRQALLTQWPPALPGLHRIEFDSGRVVLSLLFGECERMLRQIDARADALYLDGFSPARNPEMWSPPIFRALAQLSDAQTSLATWSVSGAVREGLAAAGFIVGKTQGFSGKREMLRGSFRGNRAPRQAATDRRVMIIGAGLAGSAIAERLGARGYEIELLEAMDEVAQGASGNLAGAFRPLPSKDDNPISRITRAGFLYGLQHLRQLAASGHPVLWEDCGVLHLARSAEQELKQKSVVETLNWPRDYLDWVSAAEATNLAGHTAAFGGWWFPRAGWIQPRSLVEANLARIGGRLQIRFSTRVESLRQENGEWLAIGADGSELARAPQVVLANAHDVKRLLDADWLPLRAARGQVSHLPMAQLAPLGVVVCGQGYITPGIGGHAALGASFVVDDFDLALREDEHAENLEKLGKMLPDMSRLAPEQPLEGRVSLRPVTIDRLPVVGQLPASTEGDGYNLGTLPRVQGLWTLTGFGARGLVWSTLCAELLAARMCGEPLPLEIDLAEALDPARFVIHPPRNARFAND